MRSDLSGNLFRSTATALWEYTIDVGTLDWPIIFANVIQNVRAMAEKTAGKKPTRLKIICVTFMQTRDMYLHFTRSNVWANGNR